ncbi:shikimate dehydrogenase [Bacillus piscicola]|uniref:shikimate dehydrogenase n=1 Tax=Bacillus piscicola TaxID=1632684 RepID=UPI001F09A642|nr:shikimate dehydrogenase [Bacillus piscicola]
MNVDHKSEKLFGLIGFPVGHSMSPLMHNHQFASNGLPYVYHAFSVDPSDLREAVLGMQALGFAGFNVTVPHKVEVMKYLDKVDEEAKVIGAVNTVVKEGDKWVGYNTDGAGYVAALRKQTGEKLHDYHVLIVGAGGAARAVAAALANYGVRTLTITNRTISKAQLIYEKIPNKANVFVRTLTEADRDTSLYDLIINTTSIGMTPNVNDMPWRADQLKKGCLCSDLIYNPIKTKWLQQAESQGADILNGVGMFVEQGALAFEKWTGIVPDRDEMTKSVMEQLGGE